MSDAMLVLRAKELQPGDRLVLETPQPVNAEQAAALKARLAEKFPQIRADDIVILGAGLHLQVIRPDEQ